MASHKESIWLNEYLRCWNATEAARRADYKWPNKVGPKKIEKFRDKIQQRLSEAAMGADEVLARLAEIARGEHGQYITETGSVNFVQLVEDGKAYLIKSIRDTAQGKSIEFYDGQKALVDIGRHHQLFTDRLEHDIGPSLQDILNVLPSEFSEEVCRELIDALSQRGN